MIGFGKKGKNDGVQQSKKQKKAKKSAAQSAEKDFARTVDADIHVMPERFYHAPKKKANVVTIILVILGVVLIGGLGVAAYVFTQRIETPQDVPADTVPTTTEPVTPEPEPEPEPTVIPTTTEPVAPEPEPEPEPTTLPAPDADRDGLSDQEERLYGTLPTNNDSDGDGFIDGTELVNDYDPTQPGATLAEADLFRVYQGSGFTLWIPVDWTEQQISGDTLVSVQDQNGSRVSVSVIENTGNRSITAVADQLYEQNEYEAVRLGTTLVARANTGQEYLIPDQNNGIVYRLSYQLSPDNRTHFLTTFTVMVKHFTIQ